MDQMLDSINSKKPLHQGLFTLIEYFFQSQDQKFLLFFYFKLKLTI
jgi:hypothetical protein